MKKRAKGKRALRVKEPSSTYSVQPETVSVREAKDNLSNLLDRAAAGEDIVITSDGTPKAMIVRYRERLIAQPYRADRAWLLGQTITPDSTRAIRAERDSGP